MRAMKQEGVMRAWRTWIMYLYHHDMSLKDLSISQHEARYKVRVTNQGLGILADVLKGKTQQWVVKAWSLLAATARESILLKRTIGRVLNSKPAAAYSKWLDFVGYKRLLPDRAKVIMQVLRTVYASSERYRVLRVLQTWRHYAFFMGERMAWERKMHRRTMDKYLARMMNGKKMAAFRAWVTQWKAHDALLVSQSRSWVPVN
jgi:hypothetical protein